MDKEALIQNILRYCKEKNELPTIACSSAGVGKSFISDIKRGSIPSVAKVTQLAAYLGVSTSDLVGDNVSRLDTFATPYTLYSAGMISEQSYKLLNSFSCLNDEGQEKVLEYTDDLAQSGKYIKSHPNRVDKKA